MSQQKSSLHRSERQPSVGKSKTPCTVRLLAREPLK
jgi:hypothetical protein